MLATGWDYLTLCATPQRIVDETMIYEQTKGEYLAKQAHDTGQAGEQVDNG